MADKKISELDAITGANTAADDYFVVVDTSGSVTKKISRAELNNAIERDVLSTVDINGGTIDNTVIGGTTPATGSFTNVTASGTVDGRDVSVDGAKLDSIEASATADQTASEIKTAYESNSDTNAFTDALQTKLNGIEASADVTDATNVTSAGALMTSGGTLTGALNFGTSKWSIELDAGDNDLNFKYNGTTVFKLASNGAVTSANDVTAFGSP